MPSDPAPASPRVAEELVEKCIEHLIGGAGCRDVICADVLGENCECGKVVTAIITLAQNAKLREVAEWVENTEILIGVLDDETNLTRPPHAGEVASHLRAMMVKP